MFLNKSDFSNVIKNTPMISIDLCVIKNKSILLGERINPPAKKFYFVPGGRIFKNESLKDAGKYIGVLERVLVFIFIVVGHWEAVGFLITAKSVFRFGDLTASKERKLTEYILIGTLISFGIAIVISLVYLNLRNYV